MARKVPWLKTSPGSKNTDETAGVPPAEALDSVFSPKGRDVLMINYVNHWGEPVVGLGESILNFLTSIQSMKRFF